MVSIPGLDRLQRFREAAASNGRAFGVMRRAGIMEPRLLAATTAATAKHGPNLTAFTAAGAKRHPDRAAIVDPEGTLTYAELYEASQAVAAGLDHLGVAGRERLGIMCRNHRGLIVALLATEQVGADPVLLNTGLAARVIDDVADVQGMGTVIRDHEFADLMPDRIRQIGAELGEVGEASGVPTLDAMRRDHAGQSVPRKKEPGQAVLLTSGTTGTPKGAERSRPPLDLEASTGILAAIPFRTGDVYVNPAPVFHGWGLGMLIAALTTVSTTVIRRRFDPVDTMRDVAEHRATVLTAVPVMLRRILDADRDAIDPLDTSSLRITATSGSAYPGTLATEWMDRFGDHLYNVYGSTEVTLATCASPADLRHDPHSAGRLVPGIAMRIIDDDGNDCAPDQPGRILVKTSLSFDGYTGGGTKPVTEGYIHIGDMGRMDADGRLSVLGRDDDMIVSGGENVYPQATEDALADHPDVADAAVIGVDDDEFGQRLAAYVVPAAGATVDADALRRHVRDQMARHQVPRDIEIVDELPRNTTGKVVRRELRT